MMAADPADISVLHMAFYLRSGGGLRYLNAFEGGAQQDRVDGGAHQLCERLAAGLDVRRRRTRCPRSTSTTRRRHRVRTAGGTHTRGRRRRRHPAGARRRVDFGPALPAPRATSRTAPGCAVKVHLVYPEPIWRDEACPAGRSTPHGPLLSTVDDSPAEAPSAS